MMDRATKLPLRRIISGGQTGVDRGALDAAIDFGLPHGGACPLGRLAEDGVIPAKYQLCENDSRKYSVRTEQNVVDSDGTLILYWRTMSGGTLFTHRQTIKHQRPCMLFDFTDPLALDEISRWISDEQIKILNCAGPRESSCEGIGKLTRMLMIELLRELQHQLDESS